MGVGAEEARAFIASQTPEGEEGPDAEADDAPDGPLGVWPENWPVVCLFLRLQTQWMRDELRRPLGMRHEAMQAAMAMMKLDDTARLYDELVQMEHAVMEAFYGD
jgi:hypothetical protein